VERRLHAAVARGHGLVTTQDLLAIGADPQLVARWVRQGRLVRVRRGVFTTAEVWASWDIYRGQPLARARAVQLILRVPHVASHDSAALAHRLPLLRPEESAPHVTRRHLRGSRTRGGVHHHGAQYDDGRVGEVAGLRALDIPRTVVDLAREHGYRAGLVAADGAMQLGVSRRELAAAAAEMAGWPYSLTVKAVVADADPGAESIIETLARELLEEAGLGPVETQFPVCVPSGTAWVDLRVGRHFVEADGWVKNRGPDGGELTERELKRLWWDERRREREVCRDGFGMTRLGYADYWGGARVRAIQRLQAEHAATVRDFGTELPAHVADYAARFRGRRNKVAD